MPTPENKYIDIVKSYKARLGKGTRMIPPKVLPTGPVMENVLSDGEVDIYKFPIPFIHEHDGGRYIGTEDLVVMNDPDSDWVNVGTYRIVAHAKDEVGVWISPGKHGRLIREKYFAQGMPCPVLISCGQDPILFLCSNAEFPRVSPNSTMRRTTRRAGGGRVKRAAQTADAGRCRDRARRRDVWRSEMEGPFGEFMGYYASEASEQPIIKIRRVYHRNDPILTLAIPSRPPSNFTVARAVVKAAMIWDEIEKSGLPGVQGVWNHEAGAGRLFNVVSIKQMYAGHAKQAGMLAANCRSGVYAGRWVVVVDEDIDPSNIHDVIWAMSTRCDPAKTSSSSTIFGARHSIRSCGGPLPEQSRGDRCVPALGMEGRIPENRGGEPGTQNAGDEALARLVQQVIRRQIRPVVAGCVRRRGGAYRSPRRPRSRRRRPR